MKYCSLF